MSFQSRDKYKQGVKKVRQRGRIHTVFFNLVLVWIFLLLEWSCRRFLQSLFGRRSRGTTVEGVLFTAKMATTWAR